MIQKKIVLVGTFAVGKTSLVRRFVRGIFSDRYQTTIGVKIDKKTLRVGGADVNLLVWDLAGDSEFAPIRLSHLRGASGVLLVADGSRAISWDRALKVHREVQATVGDIPFVVVINKSDLGAEWTLDAEGLAAMEGTAGRAVVATSAKTGEGVERAFELLTELMLDSDQRADAGPRAATR